LLCSGLDGHELFAPESGNVWIEAWDAANSLPYYVNFSTGDSQWEWPGDETDGVHVVQYGSEDYNWYWSWLMGVTDGGGAGGDSYGDGYIDGRGGSDGAAQQAVNSPVLKGNIFGNCFG
jgi:hypothetical protein